MHSCHAVVRPDMHVHVQRVARTEVQGRRRLPTDEQCGAVAGARASPSWPRAPRLSVAFVSAPRATLHPPLDKSTGMPPEGRLSDPGPSWLAGHGARARAGRCSLLTQPSHRPSSSVIIIIISSIIRHRSQHAKVEQGRPIAQGAEARAASARDGLQRRPGEHVESLQVGRRGRVAERCQRLALAGIDDAR